MHVTMVGGGWAPQVAAEIYGPFVAAASTVSRPARIAVVLLDEGDGIDDPAEHFAVALAAAGPVTTFAVGIPLGDVLQVEALEEADGLLVGGGLTPGYADALFPVRDHLQVWLAEREIPYAGFSAGAAIAASDAVVGGWRHMGDAVCPEESGEDLDEVTVRPGLGLVPFTIEVHADTWCTAGRLAVALSLLGRGRVGYAIDEDTALISEDGKLSVIGAGKANRLTSSTPLNAIQEKGPRIT
jgi:cyanophycinase